MKKILYITLLMIAFVHISFGSENRPDEVETVEMGSGSANMLDPAKIEILVWNQYKGRNDTWLIDFKYLKLNKDILILEESLLKEPMLGEYTKDSLFKHIMAISFGKTGVSTASTVTPESYFPLLTKAKEAHFTTRKVTLFSYYPLKNCSRPLLVINIHGINVVKHSSNYKQLRNIAKEILKFDGPIIYAGDFNSWSKKRLTFLFDIMSEHSLSDVKFNKDERMLVFGNPVDHIFLRGFRATSSRVWGNLEGSDHKAMTATLTMNDYSWCHN